MKRTLVFECIALVAIGALGLVGGISAYAKSDARTQSSLLQPGIYVTVIAAALVITALAYGFLSLRRLRAVSPPRPASPEAPGSSTTVWLVYAAIVLYGALIPVLGYDIATVLFLMAEFRILGVRSWPRMALLTVVVVLILHVLFVHYGEMVFPRGVFFAE